MHVARNHAQPLTFNTAWVIKKMNIHDPWTQLGISSASESEGQVRHIFYVFIMQSLESQTLYQ